GIPFIIPQPNVAFGPVLLNEVHLQDESLKLRSDDDPLDVCDLAHKPPRFRIVPAIGVEIEPHAVAQVDGLAYIDDLPLCILHEVTAWFARQGGENALQFFRNLHYQ